MQRPTFEQRVERLTRAVERAASETPSAVRQTALEALASFGRELADHFAEAERALPAAPAALHARLCGDLRALEERARAAGDWPESWRGVQREFARFVASLEDYERAHPGAARK